MQVMSAALQTVLLPDRADVISRTAVCGWDAADDRLQGIGIASGRGRSLSRLKIYVLQNWNIRVPPGERFLEQDF